MPGVFPGVGRSHSPVDVASVGRVFGLYDSDDDQELERIFYKYVLVNKTDVLGGDYRIGSDLCYTVNNLIHMKDVLYKFIQDHLMMHIILIAVSSAMIIAAMFVDLVTGIVKAKQRGEARTSQALKKTATKGQKYFTPYLVLVCIDVLTSVIIPFPVFSMLWATYCILCEFKSVREKSWKKAELRKAERTMNINSESVKIYT